MSKRSKKQVWAAGDYFLVPQSDGLASLGQVVSVEPRALNSLVAAFYDVRCPQDQEAVGDLPGSERILSIVLVTRDLLDNGTWRIIGHGVPVGIELFRNFQHLKEAGFVGAKIYGSGIIGKFLDAFHKLSPWDDWKDPNYLDALLVSPDKKPRDLLYK